MPLRLVRIANALVIGGAWSVLAAQAAPAGTRGAPARLPIISGSMGINVLVEVDGTVKSWGGPAADGGFYGDGDEQGGTRRVPTLIPGVHDIIDASVGYDHALLLQADGTVLGWGRNNGCSLALPDDHRRYTPVPIPGLRDVKQVLAGQYFSAAVLKDGTVRVWGSAGGGLFGNGKTGREADCITTPVAVEGLTGVKHLVMNEADMLALKDDGTVWGWGANDAGQLCDANTALHTRPVQLGGIADAVDIAINDAAAIVLADGTVRMCGTNGRGAMADAPAKVMHSKPWKVAGITTAVAVRTSPGVTMVRLKDGTLLGWGSGMFGALGDGFIDKETPKPHAPIGLGPVVAHYYSSNSGYGIRADGTMMAWGIYVGGEHEWALKPIPFYKVKLPD